jgi:hypothetical protein
VSAIRLSDRYSCNCGCTAPSDQTILTKVDAAMRAAGLTPPKKGDLTGRGLYLGAAAYGNYPGTWEVDVSCLYEGDLLNVALTAKH